MQVIAAVVCRKELIEVLRIANDGVEVDDGIEVARCADPLINNLPVGLAKWSRMVVG